MIGTFTGVPNEREAEAISQTGLSHQGIAPLGCWTWGLEISEGHVFFSSKRLSGAIGNDLPGVGKESEARKP